MNNKLNTSYKGVEFEIYIPKGNYIDQGAQGVTPLGPFGPWINISKGIDTLTPLVRPR